MFNDYSTIASEGRYKATHEEGLKIPTSKQMFQRLSIAVANGKPGNNWKLAKWNSSNRIFLVWSKRNCYKSKK